MTSESLYKWMAENNVSVSEMAEALGIPPKTLSVYKSRGLTKNVSIRAEKVIAEWGKSRNIVQLPEKNLIHCKVTDQQRETWEAADLITENRFTDYALARLDRIAEVNNATIREEIKEVAEDQAKYNTPIIDPEEEERKKNGGERNTEKGA